MFAEDNTGVPQGSVLGPLLFAAGQLDLYSLEVPSTRIFVYADDIVALVVDQAGDTSSLISKITLVRNSINECLNNVSLALNPDKSHYYYFGNVSWVRLQLAGIPFEFRLIRVLGFRVSDSDNYNLYQEDAQNMITSWFAHPVIRRRSPLPVNPRIFVTYLAACCFSFQRIVP